MDYKAALDAIPSLWDQVASGLISTIAVAQKSSSVEEVQVNKLQLQLNAAKVEIERLSAQIEPMVVQCGNETLNKLELAMYKVYKVAVFVRGTYDDREQDATQRDELLNQMVYAFQAMEDVANAGLKALRDRHTSILELKSTKIIPAKNEIEVFVKHGKTALTNFEERIKTSQAEIAMFDNAARDKNSDIRSIRDKIAERDNVGVVSDLGFSILTSGIGDLINGPSDPFGVNDRLEEAQRELNEITRHLSDAHAKLNNLQTERNQLDSRIRAMQQTEQLVPQLIWAAEAAEFRCIALQRRFTPIKDGASRLLVRAREIQEGSKVSQAIKYSKKDLTERLLRICSEALMDQALEDEARLVRDEVVNEYGGPLPSAVEEVAAEVTQKINTFSSLPSLRQGSALAAA
ncbi:hypothetical protein ACHAPO_010833 [Fusarium lateritium]